jgi:hypothetical protein
MRDCLVSYLRLIGFSACALAVALCMRFGPAHAARLGPEPRFSAPPPEADMAAVPVVLSEEEQVASLEANLTALSAEIADLRTALDVLGPLPDHPDLFIPFMLSARDDRPAAEIARRFSPVARSANQLCDMPHAGLGVLAGLERFASDIGDAPASYDALHHNIRMSRDLAEDAAIAALCVELSAISGPPRVVAPIRGW